MRRLHRCWIIVDLACADLGPAALLEEGRCDVCDARAGGSIDLTLEADRGLAHKVEIAARAGDVALVEAGALKQDIRRVLVDL